MNIQHPYNQNSEIHNFFFHPLHEKKHKTTALIVHIALTIFTGFLWQIPFWIVNRLDHKKIKPLINPVDGSPINGKNFTNTSRNKPQNVSTELPDSLGETGPVVVNNHTIEATTQDLFLQIPKQELEDIINDEYPALSDYCSQNNVRDYATEQIREYLQNHEGELIVWDDFIAECLLDRGITFELYDDPVIANDGYTYSKDALYRWFGGFRGGGHSYDQPHTPLTRKECHPGEELNHPIIAKIINKYRSGQERIDQRFLDVFPQEIREFSLTNRRGKIPLSPVSVTQTSQRRTYEGVMCFGKTLTGRTLTCQVGQNTTVLELKQQVLAKGSEYLGGNVYDVSQIRIIFCGRQLADDANAYIVTTENCFHIVIRQTTSDEGVITDPVVNRILTNEDLLRKGQVFSVLERIWERGKEDHLTRDGKKASDTLKETLNEAHQLKEKIDHYFAGRSQEDRYQRENYHLNYVYNLIQRDIECLNILLAEKITEELLDEYLDNDKPLIEECKALYEQYYVPITRNADVYLEHDEALQVIEEVVAKAEELVNAKSILQREVAESFPDLDQSCLEHLFRNINQSHRLLWNLIENLAARGRINSIQ